jgi:hypothetical protein
VIRDLGGSKPAGTNGSERMCRVYGMRPTWRCLLRAARLGCGGVDTTHLTGAEAAVLVRHLDPVKVPTVAVTVLDRLCTEPVLGPHFNVVS